MAERRYFVRYSTGPHDGEQIAEFEYLDQVTVLLTKHATNPRFTFDVIYGERVEFEPSEIIKSFRPKGEH